MLPLKHACDRKLRTLTINYTQLTVKGQVFFQKKLIMPKKHNVSVQF